MSPPMFQVLRAMLVALVGTVAAVIVSSFDKFNEQDQSPFDDFD